MLRDDIKRTETHPEDLTMSDAQSAMDELSQASQKRIRLYTLKMAVDITNLDAHSISLIHTPDRDWQIYRHHYDIVKNAYRFRLATVLEPDCDEHGFYVCEIALPESSIKSGRVDNMVATVIENYGDRTDEELAGILDYMGKDLSSIKAPVPAPMPEREANEPLPKEIEDIMGSW